MRDTQAGRSRHGVITTPQADATEAGHAVLKEGGTAIDALIAAGAMLTVTTPHMTGLGGDAIWMLHDGKAAQTILGIGQAGRQAPAHGRFADRGIDSIGTTAAAVASWDTAFGISQQWGSRIPWSRLLMPASEKAGKGFKVTTSQLFWQSQRAGLDQKFSQLQAFWRRRDGDALQHGDALRLPALANTLEVLARKGATDFYTGEVGHALNEGFRKCAINLDLDDLAQTRAPLQDPISIRYRNVTFYNAAPPTQGVTTLQALAMLQQVSSRDLCADPVLYYHTMVESIKYALRARNRQLCDPEFAASRLETPLLDELYGTTGRLPVDASVWQEPSFPADTAWMAAVDRHGRAASMLQSLYYDWGSACTIGDTGVLWHNRAAGFSSDPDHPNAWAPGKRPAHTLNPSLYQVDDGDLTLFGTQGGDGQPQTQVVLATQLIDFGQDIMTALNTPRFLLGRSFFDSQDNLKIESSLQADVIAALRRRGHDVEVIDTLSPLTGLAGIARVHKDGSAIAMHDPRGDGLTLTC